MITRQQIRRVAAESGADERTVRRVLVDGESLRSSAIEKAIRDAWDLEQAKEKAP